MSFASHFERVCTNGSKLGSTRLRSEYLSKRSQYQSQDYAIDRELVENITRKMKRGKAGDLERITREHLIFTHALLPCILAKLFVLMINNYVPISFGRSYIVPSHKDASDKNAIIPQLFRSASCTPAAWVYSPQTPALTPPYHELPRSATATLMSYIHRLTVTYSFVPYLCQLVFADILLVKLLEMFVNCYSAVT